MKIIAHRGFWKSEGAAQNSLNSILAAIREKFDGLEVDIRMSKDHVLYLNHDPSHENCTIHKTQSSDLDQLKLSNGEKLVRFTDFINIVKAFPNLTLYLEIKSRQNKNYRKRITQNLITQLKNHNLIRNSVLLSFDSRVLNYAYNIEPKLYRMVLIENNNFNIYKIYYQKINAIGFRHELILKHPELIIQSKGLGIETNAWTVNKPKRAKVIAELPITSITTDIPHRILK